MYIEIYLIVRNDKFDDILDGSLQAEWSSYDSFSCVSKDLSQEILLTWKLNSPSVESGLVKIFSSVMLVEVFA